MVIYVINDLPAPSHQTKSAPWKLQRPSLKTYHTHQGDGHQFSYNYGTNFDHPSPKTYMEYPKWLMLPINALRVLLSDYHKKENTGLIHFIVHSDHEHFF